LSIVIVILQLNTSKLRETPEYLILPKSKNKSVGSIRSQGNMEKNLAYVIGVFLGDGSVGSKEKTFCLQTIDRDFAEKTKKSIETLTDNQVSLVEMNRRTRAGRIVYAVYASDVKLCKLLLEKTSNKKNLPIDFITWDKVLRDELISGLLDSEGYVSMTKVHVYNDKPCFDMKIGIGACDSWVYELHQFLLSTGVKVGKITREKIKSGKIFAKFIFNKKSFIDNGLYFNIFRKQQRIENYKILFPGSTTIRGIPKTNETRMAMSKFAVTRPRVGGKFIKLGNDIV
jgi:hypothetical protein